MISPNRSCTSAAALLLLAACDGGPGGSSGPGAVSEGEAASIDDAAEMLEERGLPEGALPPVDGSAETSGEEEPAE